MQSGITRVGRQGKAAKSSSVQTRVDVNLWEENSTRKIIETSSVSNNRRTID